MLRHQSVAVYEYKCTEMRYMGLACPPIKNVTVIALIVDACQNGENQGLKNWGRGPRKKNRDHGGWSGSNEPRSTRAPRTQTARESQDASR